MEKIQLWEIDLLFCDLQPTDDGRYVTLQITKEYQDAMNDANIENELNAKSEDV